VKLLKWYVNIICSCHI